MDAFIRFGIEETSEEEWETIKKNIISSIGTDFAKQYTFHKDIESVENEEGYIEHKVPYGARIIITKHKKIIAWKRVNKEEVPLDQDLKTI